MFSSLQSNFVSVLATPDRPELAFRLRHALEKLTSLTRHVECLISFANSPRYRPTLQYNMHIDTVQGHISSVQLPTSKTGWVSFLKVAAGKLLLSQEEDAQQLVEKFSAPGGRYWCPAHCECALIQYLATKHGDSWDHVPAFSYIGVSKLSCGACRIWLEAFNEVSPQKFYTGGSQGKWYWPWAMPVVGGRSLREAMAGNISCQYIRFLEASGRYRSGTDSTDASLSGGNDLSDSEMEFIHSMHPPEGQASEASMALRFGL